MEDEGKTRGGRGRQGKSLPIGPHTSSLSSFCSLSGKASGINCTLEWLQASPSPCALGSCAD